MYYNLCITIKNYSEACQIFLRKYLLILILISSLLGVTLVHHYILESEKISSSKVSALFVSDVHTGWKWWTHYINRTRHFTDNLYRFGEKENCDFIAMGGDMVHGYGYFEDQFENYTKEIIERQTILTLAHPGDHEHHNTRGQTKWMQLTSLPRQYTFTIRNIKFIFVGSNWGKGIISEETRAFIEYELHRTPSLTHILFTENPLYNTTAPNQNDERGNHSSLITGRYFVDQSWWQSIINNYKIPLIIHSNNHLPLWNDSIKAFVSKYNTTWVGLDSIGLATGENNKKPCFSIFIETYKERIDVSKVNLLTLNRTLMLSINVSTSINPNISPIFTIGGRIQNNFVEEVYNHFVYESARLEIVGDPWKGELMEFKPFSWFYEPTGENSTDEQEIWRIERTSSSTKVLWSWNTSRIVQINQSNDYFVNFCFDRRWSGPYGLIEISPQSNYTFSTQISSDSNAYFRSKFVLYNSINESKIIFSDWIQVRCQGNFQDVSFNFTTLPDTTSIFPSLQFRTPNVNYYLKSLSLKFRNAKWRTDDAYILVNGSRYGNARELKPWSYNSYSLPTKWHYLNLKCDIGGCGIALYRIIFKGFKGFILNNAIKEDGKRYIVEADRNPYTTDAFAFFISDGKKPRINLIKGDFQSFTKPSFYKAFDNRLVFSIDILLSNKGSIIIFCGDYEEPKDVYINSISSNNWFYQNSTKLLYVPLKHQGLLKIEILWI